MTMPSGNGLCSRRRLFAWEWSSPWEIFHDASSTYADVLGESGLETYRELAQEAWARVPALGPNERDALGFADRFRITSIMETLATIAGDTDESIAIKKHDLSLPYRYLTRRRRSRPRCVSLGESDHRIGAVRVPTGDHGRDST